MKGRAADADEAEDEEEEGGEGDQEQGEVLDLADDVLGAM